MEEDLLGNLVVEGDLMEDVVDLVVEVDLVRDAAHLVAVRQVQLAVVADHMAEALED